MKCPNCGEELQLVWDDKRVKIVLKKVKKAKPKKGYQKDYQSHSMG